jgi:hypothetical protein
MSVKKIKDCKWNCICSCETESNTVSYEHCDDCFFYQMIDSGYGICFVLSEIVSVAWCKRACGLYNERKV